MRLRLLTPVAVFALAACTSNGAAPPALAPAAPQSTIHLLLEHEVRSESPGDVVAVVSRPVLDAAGAVAVPAGARFLGRAHAAELNGTTSLFIDWRTVVFPDGISVALSEPHRSSISAALTSSASVNAVPVVLLPSRSELVIPAR